MNTPARLHVFEPTNSSAELVQGKLNAAYLSFWANGECFVFLLGRSQFEALASQIETVFEQGPPPVRQRRKRKS